MNRDYRDIRKQYTKGTLDVIVIAADPLDQLDCWMAECVKAGCPEPTAMVLSTVDEELRPSSRVVLMKGIEKGGILFFTNYNSRKGLQLKRNPHASLLFFWPELERQVRVEGKVRKTLASESDAYFNARPLQSRISACISPQSQEIPSREWLLEKLDSVGSGEEQVTRPRHWGGYRFIPEYFEFWQGREDRLHDRVYYRKSGGKWITGRLAP
jgi:pyridoxamine 5'-phosphate oxidase